MKISTVVTISITALLAVHTTEATGQWRLIQSKKDDDLCWGVDEAEHGENIILVECDDGEDEQLWDFDNGRLTLKAKDGNDELCAHAVTEKERVLRVKECKNTDRQKWRYDKHGDNEWTPKDDSDLCVQAKGGGADEDDKLVLEKCDEGEDQKWKWD
mmetsp:Transcript_12438/g.25826  ORF Transcript_12438/g.25826 Transcript_12438/m.25826 type:complete len:157 (-) Transcript_12438:337-807(-)